MSKLIRLLGISLAAILWITPVLVGQDQLQLSVAFVGDFQIGAANWESTKNQNPSSTNIPQLRQTLSDIKHIKMNPAFTVFTGDLVMNMVDDQGQVLGAQLSAWQDLYESMVKPVAMPLLPIPGNHEMDVYHVRRDAQAPSPYMYDVWLDWISNNGYTGYSGNGPRPTAENPDRLVRDERRMTFSFDLDGNHFVIINTETLSSVIDPSCGLPYAGWIPIHWVEQDLAAAQSNPAVTAIIVIGHRPIEAPSYSRAQPGATILNSTMYPLATRLSEALSKNQKVRAYICSHAHAWRAFRLQQGKGVWQILAGNGGAPLDAGWKPEGGQYFGFSMLHIYKSGRITVLNYGRALPPLPQKFFEDHPVRPRAATLRKQLQLVRH